MKYSKTKGAGFILSVTIGLLILTAGVLALNYIPYQYRGEKIEYTSLIKRQIAESGIYQAMANLQNGKKENFAQNFDRGRFSVKISEIGIEKWRILSSAVLSNDDKNTIPALIEAIVVKKDSKLLIHKWIEK